MSHLNIDRRTSQTEKQTQLIAQKIWYSSLSFEYVVCYFYRNILEVSLGLQPRQAHTLLNRHWLFLFIDNVSRSHTHSGTEYLCTYSSLSSYLYPWTHGDSRLWEDSLTVSGMQRSLADTLADNPIIQPCDWRRRRWSWCVFVCVLWANSFPHNGWLSGFILCGRVHSGRARAVIIVENRTCNVTLMAKGLTLHAQCPLFKHE